MAKKAPKNVRIYKVTKKWHSAVARAYALVLFQTSQTRGICEEMRQNKRSTFVNGYRSWDICFRNWGEIEFWCTLLLFYAKRCFLYSSVNYNLVYNERSTSWQHLRLSLNYFLLFCILLPCFSDLLMSLNTISPPFWHLNCCHLIREIGFPHRCST